MAWAQLPAAFSKSTGADFKGNFLTLPSSWPVGRLPGRAGMEDSWVLLSSTHPVSLAKSAASKRWAASGRLASHQQ